MLESGLHPLSGNFLWSLIDYSFENNLLFVDNKTEVHLFKALHVFIQLLYPLYAENGFHIIQVYYKEILCHYVISHGDTRLGNKVCAS